MNEETAPKYITAHTASYNLLKQDARAMRQKPTETESILWKYLRCKQLGVRFRRQQIIDDYIVDFVCLEKQLIIEADGKYHNTEEQHILDDIREAKLQAAGYRIVRFTNDEVATNIDQVIESIKSYLYEK